MFLHSPYNGTCAETGKLIESGDLCFRSPFSSHYYCNSSNRYKSEKINLYAKQDQSNQSVYNKVKYYASAGVGM
jgi:hypothetical protein